MPEIQMNWAYDHLLASENRYELIYGGAGSGKSFFVAQKIVLRCLQEEGHKWLVTRKVGRTNRHSTFALIKNVIDECGMRRKFKVNKADMEITAYNGNQILFAGLDDVSKLKSITGITGIWLEEAFEATFDDFKQLDLRLRGETANAKQIILVFNPVSANSWLKRHFFDRSDDRVTITKTTYKENAFIDAEYKRVIEDLKEQDPVYYSVYGLGEWGTLGHLILTRWRAREDVPTNPEWYDAVYSGLDFGFNHASAFVRIGMKDGELYIFDEIYEKGLSNPELIDMVRAKIQPTDRIIADSAEPARIKEFQKSGVKVEPAKKGPDSVKAGIEWLRRHMIYIHPDRCPNTLAEIQAWKYRVSADGQVTDEPVAFKDDAVSALRYAVEPLREPTRQASVLRVEW